MSGERVCGGCLSLLVGVATSVIIGWCGDGGLSLFGMVVTCMSL